jgi:PRTRC genetic system protein E
MFTAIYALAKQTPISLMITSIGDELRVIVQPCPHKDGESPEAMSNGLTHGVALEGPPQELEDQFAGLIAKFTLTRQSLIEQLAIAEEALKQAAEEAAQKAKNAKTVKKSPTQNHGKDKPSITTSPNDAQASETSKNEKQTPSEVQSQSALSLF